jgi:hypothetical protein
MTQAVALAQQASTGVSQGFKNRIINGAMTIDQRNDGSAVTADESYPVDRFQFRETTDGSASVQRSTTAPAGFANSLLFTVTSADSSLGTNQYAGIRQAIEGFNVADLNWGTANAKTFTLSFWVRSSVTGTYGGVLRNSAATRNYPFSYTINSADTWEQKSITVAGDTTGTWLTTNGTGIELWLTVALASNIAGTAGSWSSSVVLGVTGQTNIMATNGATWYITGVQLEVGSTATSFDTRSYGTELQLCQRYYQAFFGPVLAGIGNSTTNANGTVVPLFVPLRASPTMGSCNIGVFSYNSYASFTGKTPAVVLNSGVFIPTNQLRLNWASVSSVYDNAICGVSVDTNLSISAEL